MAFTNPENQKAFSNILMTCSDAGSGKFLNLMIGLQQIEKEDSATSELILEVMRRFSKLIDTLDNIAKENRP